MTPDLLEPLLNEGESIEYVAADGTSARAGEPLATGSRGHLPPPVS